MALTLQASNPSGHPLTRRTRYPRRPRSGDHPRGGLEQGCDVAMRMMRHARARPVERAHHAGGLPIEGIGGRVKMGVVKTTVWGRPHQHVIESIWESS